MAWSHVQGVVAVGSTSVTTKTATFGGSPVTGNLVVATLALFNNSTASTSFSCKDGNSVVLTPSPSTPFTALNGVSSHTVAGIWWYTVPATPSSSISLTWTTATNSFSLWIDEFNPNGTGSISLDKDATANNTSNSTNVNTPSITPTNSGELLYGSVNPGGSITAPVAGGTLNGWTGAGGGIDTGNITGDAEYILSSTNSATAVSYTQSPTAGWNTIVAAFVFAPFVPIVSSETVGNLPVFPGTIIQAY